MVAAAASTPAFGALAALAAQPGAEEREFLDMDRAYFPWVNALNTLLDSLVDIDEDHAQQRHIERYSSPQAAAERVAQIATGAPRAVRAGRRSTARVDSGRDGWLLPRPTRRLAWQAQCDGTAALDALGPFARSTLFVHRLRQHRPVKTLRPHRRLSAKTLPG